MTDPEQFDIQWRNTNGCGSTIKYEWNPETNTNITTIKEGTEGTCPAIQVAIRKKFCFGRGILTDKHGNEVADANEQICNWFLYADHARNTSKEMITALDTQFNVLPYIQERATNCTASECSEAVLNIKITKSFQYITAMIAVSVCVFFTVSCVELHKNNFVKQFLLTVVYLYVSFTTYNMWHSEEFGMETVLRACHSILRDLIDCINILVRHFDTQGGGSVVIILAFVFSNLGVIAYIPLVMSYLPNAAGATDLATVEALLFKHHEQQKKWMLDCYDCLPFMIIGFIVCIRFHQKKYSHFLVILVMVTAFSYVKAQIVQLLDCLYIFDILSLFIGKTNILAKVQGLYLYVIAVLDVLIGCLPIMCVNDVLHMYAPAVPARHWSLSKEGATQREKKKKSQRLKNKKQGRLLSPRRCTNDVPLALQNK